MLLFIQIVVAKIKSLMAPQPSTSMVGTSTADKSTQSCAIVHRKDWADITASAVSARKKRLINLLLESGYYQRCKG